MPDEKRPAIEYDPHSWEVGYQAGLDGKTATSKIPPDVTDELAYWSALIEGQADRRKSPEERRPQTRPKAEPTP
jgi:hypothetical protein